MVTFQDVFFFFMTLDECFLKKGNTEKNSANKMRYLILNCCAIPLYRGNLKKNCLPNAPMALIDNSEV